MEQGIILAQADLSAVPADSFKWTIIIIIGLIILGLQIWAAVRPRSTTLAPDPLRFQNVDKFATRDFCEMKHMDVKARLDKTDAQIDALWNVVRSENEDIRDEVRKGFQSAERALGRIEGKINKDDKTLT